MSGKSGRDRQRQRFEGDMEQQQQTHDTEGKRPANGREQWEQITYSAKEWGQTKPQDQGLFSRQYLRRMTMLVEDVRAKFPIKNIPNIICETTYKSINEMREALYANTPTIPTILNGGGAIATPYFSWIQ